MSAPLVSVVVPTLNRPAMLRNALASIEAQTVQDFEILVVNDGGCDVAEIVKEYPKARYFSHGCNWGCSGTKNTALRMAAGKYIAYLDDDDRWFPWHLEKMLEVLRTGARFVYSDSNIRKNAEPEHLWFSRQPGELLQHSVAAVCSVMHERSLLAEVGFYDSRLSDHEDWDMWIRMSAVTEIVHLAEVTSLVVRAGQDCMNGNIKKMQHGYDKVSARYNRYRWVFLSPHFDDAVLSCGGVIYELTNQGIPVEIWTVCGAVPEWEGEEASKFHKQWGVANGKQAVELRREEDREACKILGATPVHLDMCDKIYRQKDNGFAEYMKLELSRIPTQDNLITSFAVGDHPDHVLTRKAAESAGRFLKYYLEIPYQLYNPMPEMHDFQPRIHPISAAGMSAWVRAAGCYKSQVGMLFGNKEKMTKSITNYGEIGARLWCKK